MSATSTPTIPYWSTSTTFPAFTPLGADTTTEVVVIGGGITGLTTAYLLAKAGRDVVLLERHRCASVDTGHTSAHLTMVTDARLSALAERFGRDHAQAVWDAGLAAIGQVDEIVREHRIDADFAWVEGYLHAPLDETDDGSRSSLEKEAALARELGFDAEYVDDAPLVARPAMRVDSQARLHPRKYLAGVADALVALGGRIHDQSAVDEFVEAPRAIKANGYTVACDTVVIATHNPLAGFRGTMSAALFQTKLALYTTYVVAGRVRRGAIPDALWWDTAEPYRYLRLEPVDAEHDLVIFGGEDHKTGQQEDTDACYRRLEARLVSLVPGIELTHRWSGQVIETPDRLPYIGRSAEHQYSATGFAGNGLTFGTLGGLMISDAILGRRNPWADLFDPHRTALVHGVWEYLKENADYPYYLIRSRFAGAEARSLRAVPRGQGQVIEYNGAKVAAYRDPAGTMTLRSAICTHMGCVVGWNPTEYTWDCPCHGSRFTPAGEVVSGPAVSPLPAVE